MFQLVVYQWYQWCHWFSQQSRKKLEMIVTVGSSKSDSFGCSVRVKILKSQSHAVNITTCGGLSFVENATFPFRFHSQYIRFQYVISVHSMSLHFKVCRRKDARTNSKKTNKPSKIFFFNVFQRFSCFAWRHCSLACTFVWNVSIIFACDFRMVLVVNVPFLV